MIRLVMIGELINRWDQNLFKAFSGIPLDQE